MFEIQNNLALMQMIKYKWIKLSSVVFLFFFEKFVFVHRGWLCIKKQQKTGWQVQAQDSPSWLDKGKPQAQGDLTLVMSSQQLQGREGLAPRKKIALWFRLFLLQITTFKEKQPAFFFSFSLVTTLILQFRKGFYYGFSLFYEALFLYFWESISLFLSLHFSECAKVLKTSSCTIMEPCKFIWSLVSYKKPPMGCLAVYISCHSWYICAYKSCHTLQDCLCLKGIRPLIVC